MTTVPMNTAQLIEFTRALNNDDHFRGWLGMSSLQDVCDRKIWMNWRGAADPEFSGRLLRLFERGHNEEFTFQKELKMIGAEFFGDQDTYVGYKGHLKGHCDGYVKNLPECPDETLIVEMKTHNDKSFKELKKKGVKESKPMHYAQMQLYMHFARLKEQNND